jgi:hypothetical protein
VGYQHPAGHRPQPRPAGRRVPAPLWRRDRRGGPRRGPGYCALVCRSAARSQPICRRR